MHGATIKTVVSGVLVLFNFNKNWRVAANFSPKKKKSRHCQMFQNSVQLFPADRRELM